MLYLITHTIKQPSPRFWKIESYEHMFGDQIEAFIEKRTIMSKRSVNIEKRGKMSVVKKNGSIDQFSHSYKSFS